MNSVGFNTNLNVKDRPITKHGLEGIKTGNASSAGRKIRDRYYYVNLLKKMNSDLKNETENMTNEIEKINKDQSEFQNLRSEYDKLQEEVNRLEGTLADYNLSADKLRSNAKADDIESILHVVQGNNQKKKKASDAMFLEKKRKEEEMEEMEEEMQQLTSEIEVKLGDLDPNERSEYDKVKSENMSLLERQYELRDEIQKYIIQIAENEHILQSNPNKKEASKLKETIVLLENKLEELQLQTNEANLPVDEIKRRLSKKINDDTNEKAALDKKYNELKKIYESYKKSCLEIEKELKSTGENESSQVLNSINAKDLEYSRFIDNFGQIRQTVY